MRPSRSITQLLSVALALLTLCLSAPATAQQKRDLALAELASKQFQGLTKAEIGLLAAMERGRPETGKPEGGKQADEATWMGPSTSYNDPSNDPGKAVQWEEERTIRADLIRWLCVNPEAADRIDPRGILIGGAKIAGRLDLADLTIKIPLRFSRCAIPSGVDLDSADVPSLDFPGSWIGPIDGCAGGAPVAIDPAFSAHELVTRGTVSLSDDFRSCGQVDLYGAKIGGDLYCVRGHFLDPGKTALRAVEITIAEDAELGELQSDGLLDFARAKIGGDLYFYAGKFTRTGQSGLSAEGATVGGRLYWVGIAKEGFLGILNLSDAKVGILADDYGSWPIVGNLNIDGFVYGGIGDGPTEAAWRLEWIRREPEGKFNPQPYTQLAKVLREGGRETDAIEVLIAKEDALRREVRHSLALRWRTYSPHPEHDTDSPRPEPPGTSIDLGWLMDVGHTFSRWVLVSTVAYGYRPLRALLWIIFFVILGTLLFRWGYGAGIVTPTEDAAYETFRKNGRPPAHYQRFNSFIFSLETFLPLVQLYQVKYWLPSSQRTDRRRLRLSDSATLLRLYLWVHIMLGWFFTAMLVAGITGLVRRD